MDDNDRKIELKDISEGIASIIWKVWCSTFKQLIKKDEFNKLDLEIFSKVNLEFILLYLHFCDREIFQLVKVEERKIIMDEVLNSVFKSLEKYDESLIVKISGGKTNLNLSKYFVYWSKMAYSINFQDLYNERQFEWSAFKELLPAHDEPLKNTLLWEFGKRISTIIQGSPDNIRIIMYSIFVTTEMFKIFAESLKSIFETVKNTEEKK